MSSRTVTLPFTKKQFIRSRLINAFSISISLSILGVNQQNWSIDRNWSWQVWLYAFIYWFELTIEQVENFKTKKLFYNKKFKFDLVIVILYLLTNDIINDYGPGA